MIRKLMLAVPLALTLAGAAHAEVPTSRTAIMPPSSKGGEVRVQVRITFFVPGTVDDGEVSFKAQEQARRRLAKGADQDEVLEYVTASLLKKLLHQPSVRLREAGEESDEQFIAAASELFGLGRDR